MVKIFHYARFDVAVIAHYPSSLCASMVHKNYLLARTYTDRHGLKDLCRELLSVDLSKQQQSSDWGADELSDAQLQYAASDVLYLHQLQLGLTKILEREGRLDMAMACFDFVLVRAAMDIAGWEDMDIFSHH